MTTIRAESPADLDAIYEVNERAFGRKEEAQLVNELRSADDFISELSLVAVVNLAIGFWTLFPIPSMDGWVIWGELFGFRRRS